MRKKRLGKDEKREVTPEFVNMSKEILYPQIQGVTPTDHIAAAFNARIACHLILTHVPQSARSK
jgi:hypothetical protein